MTDFSGAGFSLQRETESEKRTRRHEHEDRIKHYRSKIEEFEKKIADEEKNHEIQETMLHKKHVGKIVSRRIAHRKTLNGFTTKMKELRALEVNFFQGKKIITLYNASGRDAQFVVDEETATIKTAKSLFSTEASNPKSNMLYPETRDDHDLGIPQRPLPMAEGRFIPEQVLMIFDENGKEYADNTLLKDAGWKLTVGIKGIEKCLPKLTEFVVGYGDSKLKHPLTARTTNLALGDILIVSLYFNVFVDEHRRSTVSFEEFVQFPEAFSAPYRSGSDLKCIIKMYNDVTEKTDLTGNNRRPILDICVFYLPVNVLMDSLSYIVSSRGVLGIYLWESIYSEKNAKRFEDILQIISNSAGNSLTHSQWHRFAASIERFIILSLVRSLSKISDYSFCKKAYSSYLSAYRTMSTSFSKFSNIFSSEKVISRMEQLRVLLLVSDVNDYSAIGTENKFFKIGLAGRLPGSTNNSDVKDKSTFLLKSESVSRRVFSEIFEKDFRDIRVKHSGFHCKIGSPTIPTFTATVDFAEEDPLDYLQESATLLVRVLQNVTW